MTTPELLAACRAALERQKAVEAAAPVKHICVKHNAMPAGCATAWGWLAEDKCDAEPRHYWEGHTELSVAHKLVQSFNHDPARLAVAEEQLGYAQACWDDLMDTVGDDDPTAEQLAEMYDGTPHLNIAAQLLGVAVD